MNIPETLQVGAQSFPSIYIFAFFSAVVALFLVWLEGKKDGFNEFKLLDGFFLTSFVGLCTSYFLNTGVWGILAAGFLLFTLCRIWKWSIYRVLDIYSLAWTAGSGLLFLGYFLIYRGYPYILISAILTALFIGLIRYRNIIIKSGLSFFIIVWTCVGVGFLLDREQSSLIFYTIIGTLSLVSLYFRYKKNMPTNKLSDGLLKFFKDTLTAKEKRLNAEQKQLVEEDPYLKEGRATDSGEEMDEAILEDAKKTEIDVKKGTINEMLVMVRRALGNLKIGKYGICSVCGASIESARLKAFPEATTCVAHAGNTKTRK